MINIYKLILVVTLKIMVSYYLNKVKYYGGLIISEGKSTDIHGTLLMLGNIND